MREPAGGGVRSGLARSRSRISALCCRRGPVPSGSRGSTSPMLGTGPPFCCPSRRSFIRGSPALRRLPCPVGQLSRLVPGSLARPHRSNPRSRPATDLWFRRCSSRSFFADAFEPCWARADQDPGPSQKPHCRERRNPQLVQASTSNVRVFCSCCSPISRRSRLWEPVAHASDHKDL